MVSEGDSHDAYHVKHSKCLTGNEPKTKSFNHGLSPDRDGSPEPAAAGFCTARIGGEWDVCHGTELQPSRHLTRLGSSCGSIEFGGVVSQLLAACARRFKTGGSRRRQGAAVPIGTKKMVE